MNSPIFRALAPLIVGVMLMFSFYVLLRGHNAPGGGFIGGLIAAASISIYFLAEGLQRARWQLRFSPSSIAGFGVAIATISGLTSFFADSTFLTGLWQKLNLPDGTEVYLSTPLFFDIGVYFAVVGSIIAVIFSLGMDHD